MSGLSKVIKVGWQKADFPRSLGHITKQCGTGAGQLFFDLACSTVCLAETWLRRG
jgi:hypothetical protein